MVNFNELKNFSNFLSILRIFLAIPIWFIAEHIEADYYYRWLLFGLFFFGFLTDIGDGYFARKLNQVTEMGKIIDPLADKVVIITIIIKFYLLGFIPEYYFWIIVLRDVVIFTGGILVSKKIGKVLPSNNLGKGTVFSIMLFFIAVLFNAEEGLPGLYNFLLHASTLLCFASVVGYGIRGYESIKWNKNEAI